MFGGLVASATNPQEKLVMDLAVVARFADQGFDGIHLRPTERKERRKCQLMGVEN